MPSPGDQVFLEGQLVLIDHVDECSVSWRDPGCFALCGITTKQDFIARFERDARNACDDDWGQEQEV